VEGQAVRRRALRRRLSVGELVVLVVVAWGVHRALGLICGDGHWTELLRVDLPAGGRLVIGTEDYAPMIRPFSPSDPDERFYLVRRQGIRQRIYVLGGGWPALNHLPAGAYRMESALQLRAEKVPQPQRFWVTYGGEVIGVLDETTGKYWTAARWLVDPKLNRAEQWQTMCLILNDGTWDPWAELPNEPFPAWATPDSGVVLGSVPAQRTRWPQSK
jgi:hypothetical protein